MRKRSVVAGVVAAGRFASAVAGAGVVALCVLCALCAGVAAARAAAAAATAWSRSTCFFFASSLLRRMFSVKLFASTLVNNSMTRLASSRLPALMLCSTGPVNIEKLSRSASRALPLVGSFSSTFRYSSSALLPAGTTRRPSFMAVLASLRSCSFDISGTGAAAGAVPGAAVAGAVAVGAAVATGLTAVGADEPPPARK